MTSTLRDQLKSCKCKSLGTKNTALRNPTHFYWLKDVDYYYVHDCFIVKNICVLKTAQKCFYYLKTQRFTGEVFDSTNHFWRKQQQKNKNRLNAVLVAPTAPIDFYLKWGCELFLIMRVHKHAH